jgi:transposase-like protein
MKTVEEKQNAIMMIAKDGLSKTSVSEQTGIDKQLLNVYLSKYYATGKWSPEKPYYSCSKKYFIVCRHLDDGIPVTNLSVANGIPAITIRRWVKSFQAYGKNGLKDKRRRVSQKTHITKNMELSCSKITSIVNDVMTRLGTASNSLMRSIPMKWNERGVLSSPEFGFFLLQLFRACQLTMASKPAEWKERRLSEFECGAAHSYALLRLQMLPCKQTAKKFVMSTIQTIEGELFLSAFFEAFEKTDISDVSMQDLV